MKHAPAKLAPTICLLSKSDKSSIFLFFHTDFHSAQSLVRLRKHYSVKKRKNIQCYQLKFFDCSQHKQILFLNFLVFPLFGPHCIYKV
jgi:hypothetical protein